MTQNNNGDADEQQWPQIGPLLVDLQLQRRHILAGILKVSLHYMLSQRLLNQVL